MTYQGSPFPTRIAHSRDKGVVMIGAAAALTVLSILLFALFYGLHVYSEELLKQAVAEFDKPDWNKATRKYAAASDFSDLSVVGSAVTALAAGVLAFAGRLRTSNAGWRSGAIVVLVAAGLAFLVSGGLVGWWVLHVFVGIATHL
ncbi:hypothetical protein [Segniliparus rotundus]|nr:hypothetical protein [Segniliparus rotundus]